MVSHLPAQPEQLPWQLGEGAFVLMQNISQGGGNADKSPKKYMKMNMTRQQKKVLGELGPGQLGPGQLGPG